MEYIFHTYFKSGFLTIFFLFTVSCSKLELIEPVGFETNVTTDSIVFAVIGDYGKAGDPALKVAEMVKSWNPDFIITTGDNNYEHGDLSTIEENISNFYGGFIYNFDAPEKYRCNGTAFKDKINRFFPSPGNHDANNDQGLIPYLNFFTLPQREEYYSFVWGPISFFSLNSTANDISEQQDWLFQELIASETPFRIVYFHHSPYSPGPHGNSEKMQWDYYNYGVDIVMTGHDHIYSLIKKKDEETLHYIVNGIGGKSLYTCKESSLPQEDFDLYCNDSDYGAIKASATPDKLVLELYLIGDPEQVVNSLVIKK